MKSENLVPFSFENSSVRTVILDSEIWFFAQDVMDALEYAKASNPARVMSHIPEEWIKVNPIHINRGRPALLISEHGLYFFLGRSDKPKALPFQKWLAGEVLPSIRKTGSYSVNPDPVAELTENDLHNIKALCMHMRFAVGWWLRVEESIRGLNQNLASSVHDDFYHGAISSSQLINKFNFDVASMDYIKNYPYNGSFSDRHNYDVQYRAIHRSTSCRANDIPPGFKKLRC